MALPMIPKHLHLVWIGDRPFPHERYYNAWIDCHPEWDVVLWTDDMLPTLDCQPIVDRIGHTAGKVNLIRLELLARFGGVYVDADTEPQRTLDDLPVPEWADSWAMTSRNDWVQNAVMASVPEHPVFCDLVERATSEWERLRGKRVRFTAVFGSHYITRPLRDHAGFWEPDRGRKYGKRQWFRDRREGPPGEAFIIHDCDKSWKQELGGSWVRL